MSGFLRLSFLPHAHNLALLALRLMVGLSLFWKHGLEKVTHFSQMATHFPDPLHIGSVWSLTYALLCDALCSLLLIAGFATRWAALFIVVNTTVAFVLVHRLHLGGDHPGEGAWLYGAAALALFFSGAGKFSMDHVLSSHHHSGSKSSSNRRARAAAR